MQKKQKFEEKLSFALEQIYAAASGERCWSLALEGVRRVLEAKTVNLSVFGGGDVDGASFAAGRADFFMSHFMGGAGAPFSTAELLLPENPAPCRSWVSAEPLPVSLSEVGAAPQGGTHCLSAWVRRADDELPWMVLSACFQRGGAVLNDERRERLEILLPHIRRALSQEERLTHALHSEAELKQTLEHVCEAVLLLNARGQIIHANAIALSLLEQEDGIYRLAEDVLQLPESLSQKALQIALKNCDIPDVLLDTPGEAVAESQIIVPGKTSSYLLTVKPVSHAQRLKSDAVAAVLIQIPQTPDIHHLQPLRNTYGLTASELNLVHGLVNGRSLKQMAASKGTSYETMRVHLRQVFGKTGVNRQALLVNLARSSLQ